jgi:hypothetical protein
VVSAADPLRSLISIRISTDNKFTVNSGKEIVNMRTGLKRLRMSSQCNISKMDATIDWFCGQILIYKGNLCNMEIGIGESC